MGCHYRGASARRPPCYICLNRCANARDTATFSGRVRSAMNTRPARSRVVDATCATLTIAKLPRVQTPPAKRLQQLEPHLEHLVLAARQLELAESEVIKALRATWERTPNDRTVRPRTTSR